MRIFIAIALVLAATLGAVHLVSTNLQEVTLHFTPSVSLTTSVVKMVLLCVLAGVILGLLVHLFYSLSYRLQENRRRIREKREREVSGLLREGRARLLSHDTRKARQLLQKATERDPARDTVRLALAEVELAEGHLPAAVEQWQKVHENDPQEIESLLRTGAAYQQAGQAREAITAFQDVLKIDKDNLRALRNLRDIFVSAERWADAIEMQKRLLKLDATDTDKRMLTCLRYELALEALKNDQPDKAAADLKDLLKQAPEFVPAVVSLGDAFKAQGKLVEAAKRWQQGYQKHEQGVFLARLEEAYLQAEDPTSLLGIYRGLLAERPADLMLRLYFGRLCLRLEMVDEAMEHLQTVEVNGGSFAALHQLLAEAHRRRNQLTEALAYYQKALGAAHEAPIGYECGACGAESNQWLGRCGACGDWAGVRLSGRETLAGAGTLEAREIYHGEREATG